MEKSNNRKTPSIPILIVYVSLWFSFQVQAQHNWVTLPNGERISADKDGPQKIIYEINNGEVQIRDMESPKDVVKVIVTLKDKPLAFYKSENTLRKVSLTSILSSLKQTHSTLAHKIDNIASRLSSGSNFQYSFKIHRQYFTALNGMAMECNREMIRHIRALPEVKYVHLDGEVTTCLTKSIHKIRADIVQDSLGYTGKGVLVGVIDTGIDYDHSALGEGYGPGFRVIGGYDFYNDDNDPYDDNGHGTHVAGIIGAQGNSDQIGVAPNVKFLAVKVLSEGGSGPWSAIIAGIEYCLDPDGIPETDDAVDVINMSLGGTPETNNPVDAAVDNATQAGILSVIAAGNEGYNPLIETTYQTIGTPGTAETALTVGACTSYDIIAPFSSKGPDPLNFAIKPEIVAPGVDISSLFLRNQMETMSGTSMAAPHVAGVAALLKEQHPDWTPGQIKAAIINSGAKSSLESKLGSIFARGNGILDALNAATLGILVEPGTINFGLVDLTQEIWIDTIEIKVKNLRNISQHFNVEKKGNLPAEATLYLSQTSIELAPLEEKKMTAVISVPQSVFIKQTPPYAYTGSLICQSETDSVELPFSFVKSHMVVIECDLQPTSLILYYGPYRDKWVDVLRRSGGIDNKFTATVTNRTYTLWAEMMERDTTNNIWYYYHIVRKNVKVEGLTILTLHHSEAEFAAFNGVDQARDIYDNPVSIPDSSPVNFGIEEMFPGYINIHSYTYLGWKYNNLRIFFSPLDETYIIHQDVLINYGDQALLLANFTKGIQSQDDLTLWSGSENLGDLHLNFDITKKNNTGRGIVITDNTGPYVQLNKIEIGDIIEEGWGYSTGHALPNRKYVHFMANKLPDEFNPKLYLTMSIGIGEICSCGCGFSLPSASTTTSDFYINNSRDIVFFERKFFRPDQLESVNIMTLSPEDTLYLSENFDEDILVPNFQFLYQYHNSKDLAVTKFSPDLYDDSGLIYPNGIHRRTFYVPGSFIYDFISLDFNSRLYSQNRLLERNYVASTNYMFYYNYSVEENANQYRLIADTSPYTILGQRGQTTIDYEFKVTDPVDEWKSFMPSLDLFQILENGKTAQQLHPGQEKKVRLVIFDPKENVDSVSISLLKNDGSEIELATTQVSQKEYWATIPDDIPNGFLDVRARVHNAEDNQFELTISPAFYSGSILDSIYDARLQMIAQTLDNLDSVAFLAGDTLHYTLTLVNYGNRVAEDITVHFPETDYFIPVGNTSLNLDSMLIDSKKTSHTYEIPLILLFLGKKQPEEKKCYYYPTVTWKSGERTFSRKHTILVDFEGTSTHLEEFKNLIPTTYALDQNFPNPFNPVTTINYSIPQKTKVKLEVFNIFGQKVATLVDKEQSAGRYTVKWDATGLGSGVYFYKMQSGNFAEIKKSVLIK